MSRATLPGVLMRAIELITTDPDTIPEDAFVAAVLIAIGYGVFVQHEKISPGDVEIPGEQWRAICKLLIDLPGGDITKVNYGLSWMNTGPSSYEPDPA